MAVSDCIRFRLIFSRFFDILRNLGIFSLHWIKKSDYSSLYKIKNFSQRLFFLHLVFYTQIFVKQNLLCWIIWWRIALVRKNFAYEMYSENIGPHVKPKQLPFIKKLISLAILSVNSVYKFSELYVSYSLNFTTNK